MFMNLNGNIKGKVSENVVINMGVLSPGWSFIRMVSTGWSFLVSLTRWSLTRIIFHQGSLLLG